MPTQVQVGYDLKALIWLSYLDQVLSILGLQFESELIPDGDGRGWPAFVLDQEPDPAVQGVLSRQVLNLDWLTITEQENRTHFTLCQFFNWKKWILTALELFNRKRVKSVSLSPDFAAGGKNAYN